MQNGHNIDLELYEAVNKLEKGDPKIVTTALWIQLNMIDGNVLKHTKVVRSYTVDKPSAQIIMCCVGKSSTWCL
jgi:hypothetical protein